MFLRLHGRLRFTLLHVAEKYATVTTGFTLYNGVTEKGVTPVRSL